MGIFNYPKIIDRPFCASGDAIQLPIIDTASPDDPLIATQEKGYPPSQAYDPKQPNQKDVSREETNGIHQLYSALLLWLNTGGQFTFDPIIAARGGYNKHSILWDEPTRTWQRSLIDNNTFDFTKNRQYLNDRTHWIKYPLMDIENSISGAVNINGFVEDSITLIDTKTTVDQNNFMGRFRVDSNEIFPTTTYKFPIIESAVNDAIRNISGGISHYFNGKDINNVSVTTEIHSNIQDKSFAKIFVNYILDNIFYPNCLMQVHSKENQDAIINSFVDVNGMNTFLLVKNDVGKQSGIRVQCTPDNQLQRVELLGDYDKLQPTPSSIYAFSDFKRYTYSQDDTALELFATRLFDGTYRATISGAIEVFKDSVTNIYINNLKLSNLNVGKGYDYTYYGICTPTDILSQGFNNSSCVISGNPYEKILYVKLAYTADIGPSTVAAINISFIVSEFS